MVLAESIAGFRVGCYCLVERELQRLDARQCAGGIVARPCVASASWWSPEGPLPIGECPMQKKRFVEPRLHEGARLATLTLISGNDGGPLGTN